jgi:hypothetical protein
MLVVGAPAGATDDDETDAPNTAVVVSVTSAVVVVGASGVLADAVLGVDATLPSWLAAATLSVLAAPLTVPTVVSRPVSLIVVDRPVGDVTSADRDAVPVPVFSWLAGAVLSVVSVLTALLLRERVVTAVTAVMWLGVCAAARVPARCATGTAGPATI